MYFNTHISIFKAIEYLIYQCTLDWWLPDLPDRRESVSHAACQVVPVPNLLRSS